MRRQKFSVWLALVGSLVAALYAADNLNGGCDNKCRDRNAFYDCNDDLSKCWYYADLDCDLCTHMGSRCFIDSSDPYTKGVCVTIPLASPPGAVEQVDFADFVCDPECICPYSGD